MFYKTDDPVRDANRYYSEREKAFERLPECGLCGEHIEEDVCYNIDGELVCESCLEKHYQVCTEDYIDE